MNTALNMNITFDLLSDELNIFLTEEEISFCSSVFFDGKVLTKEESERLEKLYISAKGASELPDSKETIDNEEKQTMTKSYNSGPIETTDLSNVNTLKTRQETHFTKQGNVNKRNSAIETYISMFLSLAAKCPYSVIG